MDFTGLCNEVITLTNRPDLVAETQAAVRAAILRAHHLDFFPKDLYENYYQFSSPYFFQTLPLNLIPNFRAIKYIRKYYSQNFLPVPPYPLPAGVDRFGIYDPGANLPDGRYFKIIDPKESLDSYGLNKIDVAYLAGQQINIKSGDAFQIALVGAYVHPIVTEVGFNSWVASEYPYAIVFDAAAVVFKTIGYDEQNAAYDEMKKMEWIELQNSSILAEGS